jgi:D-lactate dehydrogenase (cytochrome)
MYSLSGPENILSVAEEYLHDESRYEFGVPSQLFFPKTIDDVRLIVKEASQANRPLHFTGGRTGTTGGSNCSDNSTAISFSSMNRILSVEQAADTTLFLRCEPGVTLDTIHSFFENPHLQTKEIPGISLITSNFFFAPDPTEKSAQLGGMASVNASGARSFRYGAIRNHITGCKLVTTNGDLITLERGQNTMHSNGCDLITDSGNIIHIPALTYRNPDIKNAAGYYSSPGMDVLDLIIGSEGTFGAIVEVCISLMKKPSFLNALSFFPTRQNAFEFVNRLRDHNATVSLEYFDPSALQFISNYRDAFPDSLPLFPDTMTTAILWEWNNDITPFEEFSDIVDTYLTGCGSSLELTWTPAQDSENDFLKEFRHALPEAVNAKVAANKRKNSNLHKIGTDTAVPLSVFNTWFYSTLNLLESSDIEFVIFGHIGNCHPHINLLPEDESQRVKAMAIYEEVMKRAADAGGTISAEHGIGKIKKKYLPLMYNGEALKQMKAVKTAFDPEGIFNPGNLL